MGALGRSQGQRFVLHPPTVGFAAHHATVITSCKARDAKRKGKVERPFRQLQETFLPEVELDGVPTSLGELNQRAEQWLDARVHAVPSRSTGEPPASRLAVERGFLSPLPRARFDTDYVETRRVHNIVPFVHLDGVRYSVPPDTLGQLVEIRRPVDATSFEVRWAGRVVAAHQLHTATSASAEVVWDPAHRAAAQSIALGDRRSGRHLHAVPDAQCHDAQCHDGKPVQLALGDGDFDVEVPDLDRRYGPRGLA
jgi:hypothetical protein